MTESYCFSELHQDQHLFLGEDTQAEFQEEEVLDKTPPRGICKSYLLNHQRAQN